MSSFDKVVKLACKPKPAPPKTKYLDPIIAATWSEDGAVHDVCKALVPRLREPNAVVVFKALIVLHTMIRNGATDNVLSHLSASEVLRLRNVSAGNWEGYSAPQNMQLYALYLDSRIRAYHELNHDAIQVQAETNRDMRLHNSIEEDMAYTTVPPSKSSSTKSKTPQRSKTISGRKLRVMTVEKGLLRETKTVQKMIDSLVECRFYLDDLEDELTITALRMLVKDLLILFQAGNEGVINVLEHYFEMSKYDAEDALSIYRNFCGQTERVVEYLGVAKKLQNLLNVPIPNLKHAPVSLASSLQEYLNDPNFEQNRLEYKASKTVAKNPNDHNAALSAQAPTGTPANSTNTETSMKPPSPPPSDAKKNIVEDFFTSIEEESTPINPEIVSSMGNQFQQQTAHNPFIQRQMTGALAAQPFGIQPTGVAPSMPFQFVQPFQVTEPSTPFQTNSFAVQPQQAPHHRPFSTFIPQQPTGLQSGQATGFLQPQPTGVNPFRQSVFVPQTTGIPSFNSNGVIPMPPPPTETLFQMAGNPQSQFLAQPTAPLARQPVSPSTQPGHRNSLSEVPARPASTPLTNFGANSSSISPPTAQPVKSHQTGSRNPFGVPVTPAPPVPKAPTLFQLSTGLGRLGIDGDQSTILPQSTTFQASNSTAAPAEPTISSVASSFAFTNKPVENTFAPDGDVNHPPNPRMPIIMGSNASDSLFPLPSFQLTSTTVPSHSPSNSMTGPIKTHVTGFGSLKPFKPTSSFGASLMESLPPIPQSGTTTPDPGAQTSNHSSAPSLPTKVGLSKDGATPEAMGPQLTGNPLVSQRVNVGLGPGVGLRPQTTGTLGAANPFRATMFATTSAPHPTNILAHSGSTLPFGGLTNGNGTLPAFTPRFGNSPFTPFSHLGQDVQQQNAGASLI